jgi:hypothetical protein
MASRGSSGGGASLRRRFTSDPANSNEGGGGGGGFGGGGGAPGRPGGGPGRSGPGGGGGNSGRWAKEPTERQRNAAAMLQRRGVSIDLNGMNRAQASEALDKAGLDPTWSRDSASGQSALRRSAPQWAQRAKSTVSPNSGQGKI